MYCDKREVMTGDTAALMHLAHRSTGIRLGAAERSCEELDLFALQTSHIGTGEEPGQLVVSQHATVEVGDDGFERLMTADLNVDTCHQRSERRRRFAPALRTLPGCKVGLTSPIPEM